MAHELVLTLEDIPIACSSSISFINSIFAIRIPVPINSFIVFNKLNNPLDVEFV